MCIVDDSDDGDDHKQELRVEKDAEIVVGGGGGGGGNVALAYCMRGHKPENRDECGARKQIMDGACFWDVDDTENPY